MTGQKIYIKDKPILTFFKGEKMKIQVLIFMFSLHEGGAQRTIANIINNIDKNKFEILLGQVQFCL